MALVQGTQAIKSGPQKVVKDPVISVISGNNVGSKGESAAKVSTVEDQFEPDPIADEEAALEAEYNAKMAAVAAKRLANKPAETEVKAPIEVPAPPVVEPEQQAAPEPEPEEKILPAEEKSMDLANKFLVLEVAIAGLKKLEKEYYEIVKQMVEYYGAGFSFYDPGTKAAYRCENNFEGKEVIFKSVGVNKFEVTHTRRPQFDEKQGSLSMKEAKDLGFDQIQ